MEKVNILFVGISEPMRQAFLLQLRTNPNYDFNWEQASTLEDFVNKMGDGNWHVVVGHNSDTSRMSLHETQARYDALTEAASDFIYVIGLDERVKYVNSAACQSLNLSYDQVIGKTLSNLFPTDLALMRSTHIKLVIDAGKAAYYENSYFSNNQQVWLGTSLVPLRSEEGQITSVLGVSRDITAQKQAEDELRRAFQQEKDLSEVRSRFASMISHEFGTPLSVILSSAELLEYYGDQWSLEKRLEHLRKIQASAMDLNQMVRTLLEMQRMTAQMVPFSPEPVNLLSFCQSLVSDIEVSVKSPHRVITNISPECPDAYVDVNLTRQAIGNLLSNSLKYSPMDSPVYLEVECKDSWVTFTIQDSGIGIPEGDIPQLFTPFFRGENTAHISGYGLGLPIMKMSVEIMGGNVQVDSKVGLGTTFTVRLPQHQSQTSGKTDQAIL